jgi:hypothetical protein
MKIVVNGGLGNQLFQIAYAHRGLKIGSHIEIYQDPNPRQDRPFELDEFLLICKHSRIKGTSDEFLIKNRLRVIKILLRMHSNFAVPFFQKVFQTNLEVKAFTFENSNLSTFQKKLSAGYFQHWRYIENARSNFGLELSSTISKVKIPENLLTQIKESAVLHVRQGDLNNVKTTMGILSAQYYSRALDQLFMDYPGKNVIVVTDDVPGAQQVLDMKRITRIIGPETLDAWQTLKIMSLAPYLVTANSTLSWWGGYLAKKAGATVVLPQPWFLNWHEEVGDAFYFPGSNLQTSDFI